MGFFFKGVRRLSSLRDNAPSRASHTYVCTLRIRHATCVATSVARAHEVVTFHNKEDGESHATRDATAAVRALHSNV